MTTEVQHAEKLVRDFEDKRRHIIEKAVELADERQRVSFAAHSGDAKARTRLRFFVFETRTSA